MFGCLAAVGASQVSESLSDSDDEEELDELDDSDKLQAPPFAWKKRTIQNKLLSLEFSLRAFCILMF